MKEASYLRRKSTTTYTVIVKSGRKESNITTPKARPECFIRPARMIGHSLSKTEDPQHAWLPTRRSRSMAFRSRRLCMLATIRGCSVARTKRYRDMDMETAICRARKRMGVATKETFRFSVANSVMQLRRAQRRVVTMCE